MCKGIETEKTAGMQKAEIVIIGGGPAGMSAAVAAYDAGARDILILEREEQLGGILEQCIHNGFGLHRFREELTGPEYGERYARMVEARGIRVMVDTMVIDLTADRVVTAVNRTEGYFQVKAGAVILAMGCRERPRGALNIPGTRPSGIFTAGTAQKFVNMKGYLPGNEVVILGSGDIGLIMARRMTLEGSRVKAVLEIMEDSGGLTRNIVQCLQDYHIPLKLRHTVVEIHGKERLTGVTIARVDDNLKPIPGTEEEIPCDTLLLSVGLIPENELSKKAGISIDPRTRGPVVDLYRQTTAPGIFACGNVVKVHELVDFVSEEGALAGKSAAHFVLSPETAMEEPEAIGTAVQQKGVKNLKSGEMPAVICTVCPMGCKVTVEDGETTSGNRCSRGRFYALQEMTAPKRTLTTTVMSSDGRLVPVKTDVPIPREKIFCCMKEINSTTLLLPIEVGTIIIEDIGGTGANLVAARSFA